MCSIFVAVSEPIGLKFGHNTWIGPERDGKDFYRDSFASFLNKKDVIGVYHYTLAAVTSFKIW